MPRFRKEINEKSPMRVFELSRDGGLGLGNIGVVCSARGIGKSALLVQLALDDLMRGRRVLHVALGETVARTRATYDEIFHELCLAYQLPQPQALRLEIERQRLLVAARGDADGVVSAKAALERLAEALSFCREAMQFEPHTIVLDGFDFDQADEEDMGALRRIADDAQVELWLSARSSDADDSLPEGVARHSERVHVIVRLTSDGDAVRLDVVKEHDNPDVSAQKLWLDAISLRIVDSELPRLTSKVCEPHRFHLYSGGAQGAEAYFGECAQRWGVAETHYSFEGHPFLARERGVVVLGDDALSKGDSSLVYASHRLGRPLSDIPNIKRILQAVWHQVTCADEVFVIGSLQEDGTVRGGTGWGAELARLWGKPVAVFDQLHGAWYRWDVTRWEHCEEIKIVRPNFAGLGTMRLTGDGRAAIERLFSRTFGPVG